MPITTVPSCLTRGGKWGPGGRPGVCREQFPEQLPGKEADVCPGPLMVLSREGRGVLPLAARGEWAETGLSGEKADREATQQTR